MSTTQIAQKLTAFGTLNYDTVVSKLKLVLEASDASFYFSHSAVIQDGQLLLSVEGHFCYEKEESKELVSEFFYRPGELTINEARLEVLKSMFLLTVGQESIEPDPDKEPKPEPEEEQEAEDLSCETSSLNEEEQGVSEAKALSGKETSSSLFDDVDDEAPAETIAGVTKEEAHSDNLELELDPESTEDALDASYEEESTNVEAVTEAEAKADVEPEPKAEPEQSPAPVENTAATVSEDEAYEPVRIRGLTAAKEKGANDSLLFKWETMPAKAAVHEIKDWIISQSQQDVASA